LKEFAEKLIENMSGILETNGMFDGYVENPYQ
jgi:hypothetical protein